MKKAKMIFATHVMSACVSIGLEYDILFQDGLQQRTVYLILFAYLITALLKAKQDMMQALVILIWTAPCAFIAETQIGQTLLILPVLLNSVARVIEILKKH